MAPNDDLSSTQAMVVDANPTSRAILVTQLRDFGVGTVVQCTRTLDARRMLEYRSFDIVLCENDFGDDSANGQELLDDLRRNQLLPFSTVFIMITHDATYSKVAEAAESALDGYLLKPHTANSLAERLYQARRRKLALQDIFSAIESEQFEDAAHLCLERFASRAPFWLYAARIGAELLLRLEHYAQAQEIYEAVVAAKTLPWAKLGVARAQLDSDEPVKAMSTLENLIAEDPNYADAYDVLGRAQFELGHFDRAMDTYKMACDLTPHSITRLQNLGMMSFYCGEHKQAEKMLGRTARLGLDSKMFDAQTLVLLAFTRLESGDHKGLQHCQDDFVKLLSRHPQSIRIQRLSAIVDALLLIQQRDFAKSVRVVRELTQKIRQVDFDFESATNLLALLAQLSDKSIRLDEVDTVVDAVGLRFCISRSMGELLAGAAGVHSPYAEHIRTCSAQIIKYTEDALSISMRGNPTSAVKDLLIHGKETLNVKLIETAFLVLQRYAGKVPEVLQLTEVVKELRALAGPASFRPRLGEPRRQAGGLSLRTNASIPAAPLVSTAG
jgi:cytochrome c-type biogenesis protein CcmH/NrfG